MTTSVAPWTDEQVKALNAFQMRGRFHPFTCGAEHATGMSPVLTAGPDGWRCPDPACDYTQDWAHTFMVDFGKQLTEIKPPCGTTRHCTDHGFCSRCDPELAGAGSLIAQAIGVIELPFDEAATLYCQLVAQLRTTARAHPKDGA